MHKKIERSEDEWLSTLTHEQYRVLREGGTEAPPLVRGEVLPRRYCLTRRRR